MRIPSQFNDENLYRRGSRGSAPSDTYRRLIRLTVGMVLVLVVMRQAARPEMYEAFFGSPPAQGPVTSRTIALNTQDLDSDATAATLATEPSELDPQDLEVGAKLTEELRTSDRRQWVVAISRWQTGRPVRMVPSTLDSIEQSLAEQLMDDPERQSKWLAMLESLERSVETVETADVSADTRAAASAWLTTLDRSAAEQVVDGSTWRSGDFDTFYRFIDEAPWMSGENVAFAGVLPLLQQPDVYRNQLVRVTGTVARAEKIAARENPFEIQEYWEIWLRPKDGADRPMLLIVPEVPAVVAEFGDSENVNDGPAITMVGRFLKRWSYRSAAGADLAPVVVGRLLAAPVVPTAVVPEVGPNQAESPGRRLLLIIAFAAVIGLTIAIVVMWRTGQAARHARMLRTAHRQSPNEFLDQLGDQPTE